MKKAKVFVNDILAAKLIEKSLKEYILVYETDYNGPSISLTLPKRDAPYLFTSFPPFFEGLLPEGIMLETLLRKKKIDQYDYLYQLIAAGTDTIGSISIKEDND